MAVGRKREFDIFDALSKATKVFWANGYSGTSLSELTQAMGISRPSMYAAFGNKEELFVGVLNHYVEVYSAIHGAALQSSHLSLQDRLGDYLRSIADTASDTNLPGGCLITRSNCEYGGENLPEFVVKEIRKITESILHSYKLFFELEQSKGNLGSQACPEQLSDCLLSTQHGISVMSRKGIPVERLYKAIDHFVLIFK